MVWFNRVAWADDDILLPGGQVGSAPLCLDPYPKRRGIVALLRAGVQSVKRQGASTGVRVRRSRGEFTESRTMRTYSRSWRSVRMI